MKEQSIKKNYILNTTYQILALVSPLITAPYVSRVLSATGVGIYSYTNSIVAMFTMFACLGTTTYGQRAIAQVRDDKDIRSKLFWEIEILSIFTTLIVGFFWVGFICVYPQYKLYFLILSFELVANAFDVSWFYSGLERFTYIVFRNMAIKILGIILIFTLVNTQDDLWIYIAILSVTKFLGNASMWIALPKFVNRVKIRTLNIRPHIKETFAYFIPTAAASVYTYFDKIMLGMFTESTNENGYYEQAYKIINMAYTVVVSLNTVMSARMSYLFAKGDDSEIKYKLEQALAFILTLSIPLAFGICGVSYNFVPWFFGSGYEKVSLLLIIASPTVVIMSLHNFLSAQYLVPSGQRVRSTKGVVVGACVNFILNYLLIPHLQSVGAFIATIIAEGSICLVYFYMSKEYVPIKLVLKYLPKQLIAGSVMLCVTLLIGNGHNGEVLITILQVVVGAAVYGGLLLLMREKFTVRILAQVMKRIKK